MNRVAIRGGFRVDLIAKGLEAARLNKPGSFEAVGFVRFRSVLVSAFKFGNLSEVGRYHVTANAIARAAKTPPISEQALVDAVGHELANYRRRRTRRFVVLTQVSVNLGNRRTVRLRAATLTLGRTLPRSFERSRAKAVKDEPAPAPLGSVWARIHVRGRTPVEALELGLARLDTLRGIWIEALTGGSYSLMAGGYPKPTSPVVVGPQHTVHKPNGEIADPTSWHRLGYVPPSTAKRIDEVDSSRLWQYERKIRRALSKLTPSYRETVEKGLARYADALDEVDREVASMKLWSVLELLTATRRHEIVASRASARFRDSALHRTILENLRLYRNRVVHEGHWRKDSLNLLSEMKLHVEALLRFHIWEGCDFDSLEAAGRFLDLPRDRKMLRKAMQAGSSGARQPRRRR